MAVLDGQSLAFAVGCGRFWACYGDAEWGFGIQDNSYKHQRINQSSRWWGLLNKSICQRYSHFFSLIFLYCCKPRSTVGSFRYLIETPSPDRDHGQSYTSNGFQSGSERFDPSPVRHHQVDRSVTTNCPSLPEPCRFNLHLPLPPCLHHREQRVRRRPSGEQDPVPKRPHRSEI